jgi:Tol biopolymer transport system component
LVVNVLTGEIIDVGPGSDGAWSPDGQYIAYVRNGEPGNTGDVFGLYVATPDGGEKKRIMGWERFDGFASGPDWSPDGERLAFSWVDWDGEEQRIYSIAPNGTQLQRLLAKSWTLVQWSPNGRYISFSSGNNLTLSILDVRENDIRSFWSDLWPSSVEWSADSAYILVQGQSLHHGIYLIRIQDGAKFDVPVSGYSPTW